VSASFEGPSENILREAAKGKKVGGGPPLNRWGVTYFQLPLSRGFCVTTDAVDALKD